MEATQEGASIHDRIMSVLETEEPKKQAVEAEAEQVEVKAEQSAETDEAESTDKAESETSEETDNETQDVEAEEEGEPLGLDVIAQYLGIEMDKLDSDDDGLYVKTKIDGEEGKAKFTDILKSYQLEGHLNKQNMEVAEQKKALQAKIAEYNQQLTEKLQQAEDLSQLAYNDLLTEYNSVNWNELRTDDPAEYAAKLADYQNRQAKIAQAYQDTQNQRQALKATDEESLKAKVQEESQKILEKFPAWSNPETYKKEWGEISSYAQSQGFSKEDVDATIDHRMYVLLDKARRFDELSKGSKKVENIVRKAPRIAKPGSTATKIPTAEKELGDLQKQIKKAGGGQAVRDYLLKSGIAN